MKSILKGVPKINIQIERNVCRIKDIQIRTPYNHCPTCGKPWSVHYPRIECPPRNWWYKRY